MSEPSICRSSQPIDLNSVRSRIFELKNVDESSKLGPEEAEELTTDFAHALERKIDRISLEWSSYLNSLSSEDLTEILGQLTKEMGEVERENVATERELEKLQRRCGEDYDKMESELEKLYCSLEFIELESHEKSKENMQIDVSCHADDQADFSNGHGFKFKEMANSLNTLLCRSISNFTNSIEEILMEQMREELHPDSIAAKCLLQIQLRGDTIGL